MKKLMIGAAICLFSLLLAACYQQTRSADLAMEHKQDAFGNIQLTLTRGSGKARTAIAGAKAVAVLVAREIPLTIGRDGACALEIPDEWRNRIEKIHVVAEGRIFEIPYERRAFYLIRDVKWEASEYKHWKFSVFQRKVSAKPAGPVFVAPAKDELEIPFEGKVLFRFADKIEKTRYTGDGRIEFAWDDADELKAVVSNPEVRIIFEDGSSLTQKIAIVPLTGKVALAAPTQDDRSFKAELSNGTYFPKRVRVRAGYVKADGSWFDGGFFSSRCYEERIVLLPPGAQASLELDYRQPILGHAELKYEWKVL